MGLSHLSFKTAPICPQTLCPLSLKYFEGINTFDPLGKPDPCHFSSKILDLGKLDLFSFLFYFLFSTDVSFKDISLNGVNFELGRIL